MTKRMFIFGAGYSGRAIARNALSQGWHVAGTTRSPEKAVELAAAGIEALLFDGVSVTAAVEQALATTTHLIVSAAPGEEGDPVLEAAGRTIADGMPDLAWIGYLSTVGVYGDHGGAWVDEDGACRPVSRRSRWRFAAERAWLELGRQRGTPVALLRLSGIYGPGRNGLVNLAQGTARRIVKRDQVFNRIHAEDIAGAALLLAERTANGAFNVTDDEPAPPQDVVAFAAALMGIEPPPETAFDEADMTPMARSFYGENKRVSNAQLKALGYRFRYPDYRAALTELWESGTWRAGTGRSKING